MPGIELLELNSWLGRQLATWQDWGANQDAGWLTLATGNERFPAYGDLFRHAFSPLRRYSDQAEGREPSDDSHVGVTDWAAQLDWAGQCLNQHRRACEDLDPQRADDPLDFRTRSAGVFKVSRRHALAHAATHCFWTLSGIAHLLRAQGIVPPQRSDFIFWAAEHATHA